MELGYTAPYKKNNYKTSDEKKYIIPIVSFKKKITKEINGKSKEVGFYGIHSHWILGYKNISAFNS